MEPLLGSPPFTKNHQLCRDLDLCEAGESTDEIKPPVPVAALPGQPCIVLNDSIRIKQFLIKELWAQDLEAIAPHLWVMSTPSSANINPLHRQKVKGRDIIVTEDPRLHLVWISDRIFIKPIPKYILSHAFWEMFLLSRSSPLGDCVDQVRKAAKGYLRTYRLLIQHESDFIIAQQDHLRLVPKDVDWTDFCSFLSDLDRIEDADVSGRYCYGELRLSRLNLYAPLLLRKFHFEQVHGQYGDYFARLYGPILFIFAVVSTILNAMQVEMAAEQLSPAHWVSLWSISRWFSTISLVGTALISLCFILLWSWMVSDEWVYTIRCRLRTRRARHDQPNC
ncbi:hypothetical protein H2199_003947 [Coniosporium tulheliwenetii]|uniref:Uncharacterized protein n=1 Tax=Coniosporium tulheliwenetii TaxID=3383036 RepID=A0ACC2Z8V2_9PEZI|nr:hypothetical protein H2199_003947 [Cladosporium sp. JES 115]